MGKSKIDKILSGIDQADKKDILNSLVSTLIKGLNDAEKKEIIKAALSGKKEGEHLESMVEH